MNGQTLSLRRRVYNRGMRALVWLCAGLTCALLSVLVSTGVSVLEPQLVRAARLKARVKINASAFFMFVFLFYLIFGFSPFHNCQCTGCM